MHRTLSYLLVIIILLAGSYGCRKKPPQEVTPQSKSTLSTIRDLRAEYERKDVTAFMRKVSKQYPGRKRFRQSLQAVFTRYDSIRFTIHYTKMLLTIKEKTEIRVTFNWDGEWRTAGGSIVKDGGRVTFVLDPKGEKLRSISGTNPFLLRKRKT